MSNEDKVLTEEDGFFVYNAVSRYDEDKPEPQFKLYLPNDIDDAIGWFKIKLADGRKFTVYSIKDIIDGFINYVGLDSDGAIDSDALDDEEDYENNRQIELKDRMFSTIRSVLDHDQAKLITDKLWDNFRITEPE